jgi:phosphate/sulfate permease
MSASWRKGISTAGNIFGIGLVMCLLSIAINWSVVKAMAVSWFLVVPVVMLVGAVISWRPNR